MNIGFPLITAKRTWYVPEYSIWGTSGWSDFEFLVTEVVDSVPNVMFDNVSIGESAQEISFNQLKDFRGNILPFELTNPRVFVKPKSENTAFVGGSETSQSFKIARKADLSGPVVVDLYIIEMG